MKNITTLLRYLCLAFILGFLCEAIVCAADAVAAPADVAASALASPWYLDAKLWEGIFGALVTLWGIWRHNVATATQAKLTTAQQVIRSVVIGVEAGEDIPAVAPTIDRVKNAIQDTAAKLGVGAELHAIVQNITEPAASGQAPTA